MSFKNSWKTRGISIALAYGMFYLLRNYFSEVLFELLFDGLIWEMTNNIFVDIILFFMILMLPVAILHEWLHGIIYKIFGGKVKYRLKGVYITAQETSQKTFDRTQYLVILLAPVTLITLLSLLIPGWMGGTVLILNLLKSSGDILKILYLFKVKSSGCIIEKKYGFDVIDEKSPIQLTFENL